MNSLFGGLETCLRNRAYLIGESTKYFTLQKHLAWFHIKLSLAHTSAFLGLRLDPVTLESSAKQSNTSVPMMRLHEMIVFQDLLCFLNWNLCQGKIFIIRRTFTFINTYCKGQKVPGQALGGTQVNNTWRYAVYMQMKQIIWVLKADARVTVRKYNNWLWNAFSVILFFLWWDWVARYPEMQEYLNTAIFYHTF